METLYNYINNINTLSDWDGHVHLFNHKNPIPKKHEFDKVIGFMDIEYDDVDNINILNSYTDYIKNYWDKDKEILLATGITIEDIKSVYEKYKDIIKGFGELKCYDKYGDVKIPYKNIQFVKNVVKFSNKCGNLPVYIHWELNTIRDVEKIESILKSYPSVPIVLCHCGMNENNKDFAFSESLRLQRIYSNLWLDISWDAADYFTQKYFMSLDQYDRNRIILGTDINNKIFSPTRKHKNSRLSFLSCLEMFKILKQYLKINNSDRICNLFNIKRT